MQGMNGVSAPTADRITTVAKNTLTAWGTLHATSYGLKKANLDSPLKTGIAAALTMAATASLDNSYSTVRSAGFTAGGYMVAQTVKDVYDKFKPDTSSPEYKDDNGDKTITAQILDEVDEFTQLGSGSLGQVGAAPMMPSTTMDLEALPTVGAVMEDSEPMTRLEPASAGGDGIEDLR